MLTEVESKTCYTDFLDPEEQEHRCSLALDIVDGIQYPL